MANVRPRWYQKHFHQFADCPVVDVAALGSVDAFWQMMRREPMPRKLVEGSSFRSASPAALRRLLYEHLHWNLSGTIVTAIDDNPKLWRRLQEDLPLPEHAQPIDLYPMLSIGPNNDGEKRLASHRHGATAMRLLLGEKVWAFRPPGDPECVRRTGGCPLPFDVCAHHRRAPLPCVQRAGETVVFPDGWHHGTCNTAAWTVGWGGQGLRIRLTARSCDGHANTSRSCDGHTHSHAIAPIGLPLANTRRLVVMITAMAAGGALELPTEFPPRLAPEAHTPTVEELEHLPWLIALYHGVQSALKSFAFQLVPAASRRLFQEDCDGRGGGCSDDIRCKLIRIPPSGVSLGRHGVSFGRHGGADSRPGRSANGENRKEATGSLQDHQWSEMSAPGEVHLFVDLTYARNARGFVGSTLSFGDDESGGGGSGEGGGGGGGSRSDVTLAAGEAAMWVGAQLRGLQPPRAGATDHGRAYGRYDHGKGSSMLLAVACSAPLPADEATSWRWRDEKQRQQFPGHKWRPERVRETAVTVGVRQHEGVRLVYP